MCHLNDNFILNRVVALLALLTLTLSVGLGDCSHTTPSSLEITPPLTHTGLIFYSQRDGIPNQGGLYFLDLESGAEQRLTNEEELITMSSMKSQLESSIDT